ncbi:hypothetical protein [Paraglaciecola aestuariivivens]
MTVDVMQLWLPILLSGMFAWLASSVIHMVLKYHSYDYKKLENEDQVLAALGQNQPAPGIYTMPHCSDMKEMGDEALQKKFNDGPVAMISVLENGMPPMGKLLGLQFLYFVLGSALVAYMATLALPVGAEFQQVMVFAAKLGFLAFGFATIPYSIWYGHPWAVTGRFLIDALIYALVIAATLAWLWPSVS